MRRKGDGPQSPLHTQAQQGWRQHRTGGVAATLRSSGKERLIVSLQKSKQSDCEEKAGAGFVTFKLGSAYGLPFCCQLDDSVGKGMCSQC